MADLTDWFENKVLEVVARSGSWTVTIGSLWVALFTVSPGEASLGTQVTTAGYGRQSFACDAASGGQVSNNGPITFTFTANMASPAVAVGLVTSETATLSLNPSASQAGLVAYKALPSSIQVNSGQSIYFATGELIFTIA